MLPPNILITNHCNQSCDFCFAKQEFKLGRKEMSIDDFKCILNKLKKSNIEIVKLMGGEPFLHKNIEEIILLSSSFKSIVVFTNGLFNLKKINFLADYSRQIKFSFNLSSPAFVYGPKKRSLIIDNIQDLIFNLGFDVALSFTLNKDVDSQEILENIPNNILCKTKIRIGIANPQLSKNNDELFPRLSRLGDKIYEMVKEIRASESKQEISLNCGMTECMFSTEALSFFEKNNVKINGWGCLGKVSSFDISTNSECFHCFPLSQGKRIKIKKKLTDINSSIYAWRFGYNHKRTLPRCKNCPSYGFVVGKCSGPCLAGF